MALYFERQINKNTLLQTVFFLAICDFAHWVKSSKMTKPLRYIMQKISQLGTCDVSVYKKDFGAVSY